MPFWPRSRRRIARRGVAALACAWFLTALFIAVAQGQAGGQKPGRKAVRGANELTLAGLRPGRDTRATALAHLHKPWGPSGDATAIWRDVCHGSELRVEFGEKDVVESVALQTGLQADCVETKATPAEAWKTGHGLALGEMRERVMALYGKPDSHGPSTKQGDESEFYYYAFDWAGSDVPQVLEVTCDKRSGRVVQITLAAQSL